MHANPSDPSLPGPEENPYAPPRARTGEAPFSAGLTVDLVEAEAIRREHIGTEASIKAIGALHILGAIVGIFGLAALLFGGPSPLGIQRTSSLFVWLVVYMVFIFGVNLALFFGLRALKGWARWVDVVLLSLSLLFNLLSVITSSLRGENVGATLGTFLVSTIIPVYILHLLLSKKGSVVFTPEYKEVIAKTPHVKYQTSWIVKGCLIIFILVVILALVGALLGPRLRASVTYPQSIGLFAARTDTPPAD
jgi:hypothetical protein